MLGGLLYRPWELWQMTYRDVMIAIDGYNDSQLVNQLLLRRATFIIASSNFGGKAVAGKMHKLWPIPQIDAGKSNINQAALDTLKRFKDQDMADKAKKLSTDGRRIETNSRSRHNRGAAGIK